MAKQSNPTNQLNISRQIHELDAKDFVLGRLATAAANLLRGKQKVTFAPYKDVGDYVRIVNARDIKLTGNKLENKVYYSHSGYPGGLKETKLKARLITSPERVVRDAIIGMLPNNRLRKSWLKRLTILGAAKA